MIVLVLEMKVKEIEEMKENKMEKEKIKKRKFKSVRVSLCTTTPGGKSND